MEMETDSTPREGTSFVPERGFYQPSTEDTREAYQALISIIEQQLGVRSDYLMYVAAEEILSVLKSGFFEYEFQRKFEIEKILRPIPFHIFNQLVSIGKVITDYQPGMADPEQGFYQPRTEDTWTAYKNLIDVLGTMIGSQPLIDQCKIAHGVLLILKDESIHDKKKRQLIEGHLCLGYKLLHETTFKRLVEIAWQIWDFDEFRRVEGERYVGGYREEGIGPSWGVQDGAGGVSWESNREINGGDVVSGWGGKVNADGGGGYGWGEGVKAGGGWSTQFGMDMVDEVKKGVIDGGGDGWGNKVNACDGWSNPFAMDMVDEVKKGAIDGGGGGGGGWWNEFNTKWSMQGSNGFDGVGGWGECGESSSKFPIDGQDKVDESNEEAVNGVGVDLSVLKLDCEANDKVLVDGILDLSIHEIKNDKDEANGSDLAMEKGDDLDMSVLKLDCEANDKVLVDGILDLSIHEIKNDKDEANGSDLAMEKGDDLDMSVLKLDDDKDENDSDPVQENAEKDEDNDWVMVDFDGTDK